MWRILFVFVLLASATSTRAQSLDDQERCATQARKAFNEWESEYKKPGPGGMTVQLLSSDYESHFNTKMKKCLVLIEWSSNVASGMSNTAILSDAYERHIYASYLWLSSPTKKYWEVPPVTCEMIPSMAEKKNCTSREEFDAFVGRYLEK